MTEARIVLTTLDDADKAARLAHQLVEWRLAACVNLVERVRSIYRWQGKVETANEILLVIKTTAERIPVLQEKIGEIHPYSLPEFLVLTVTDASEPYLAWLGAGSRDEAE